MRYVRKKDEVLIGFHERASRYLADMKTCAILPPHVSAMMLPLRALVKSMEARETLPQIEMACGDEVTALVLRHLEPLSEGDVVKLREFAALHGVKHRIQWWLQSKGPETVKLLDEGGPILAYALPEFGITMPFKPTDFTQVNPDINRVLVSRALRLLGVQKTDRVIDWFCGLGNFTLPLATLAREVLGIEGSDTLVKRAKDNAKEHAEQNLKKNMLLARTESHKFAIDFAVRNLFEMTGQMLVDDGYANRWLIDPPREGAFALVKALAQIHQQRLGNVPEVADGEEAPQPVTIGDWQPPQRIVYVSCNPSTLARDAGLLVHQAGYRCTCAGVINMFPHTAHVESMAVFELQSV
jgi:23S rRNA (uracil1939-C5)-methyltransferase